jgi:hypothetical protein
MFPSCQQCGSRTRPATANEAAIFGGASALPGMLTWQCPSCGGSFVRPLEANPVDEVRRYLKQEERGFQESLVAILEVTCSGTLRSLTMTHGRSDPKYIPLIFALKDLRIRYNPEQVNSPAEFSRSTCLVRGDSVLARADDAVVNARFRTVPLRELPTDPMDALLRRETPGWPDDAFLALRGVFAFGPGNDPLATQCALHSLKLNRDCTLARQLFQLLSEEKDPRIPFSDRETEVMDVLAKLAGGHRPKEPAKKLWWRFW